MSESFHHSSNNWNEESNELEEEDESDPSTTSTILLRVRRRRGAFTEASSTLRLELDAALAAAHALDDWDIHSSSADILVDEEDNTDTNSSTNKNYYDNGIGSTSSTVQPRRHSQSLTTTMVPTTAIFRRIESTSLVSRTDDDESFCYNHNAIRSSLGSTGTDDYLKRARILDAVLLDNGDDHDDHDDNNTTDKDNHQQLNGQEQHIHTKKRRRLTLQIIDASQQQPHVATNTTQNAQQQQQQHKKRNSLIAKSRNKNIIYPILTPEQRMIDDSLHQVFSGTQSLQQHYQLIESISSSSRTTSSTSIRSSKTNSTFATTIQRPCWLWPYMWSHKEYGNWLHAAAIWNEAILVKEIISILQERIQQQEQNEQRTITEQQLMIYNMLQARNNEGLSPMDVAQLSGNHEVLLILEHYVSITNVPQQQQQLTNNDTTRCTYDNKYDDENDHEQYDLYSLVVVNNNNKRKNKNRIDSTTSTTSTTSISTTLQQQNDPELLSTSLDIDDQYITDCELHNNCRGYWDERGNLILSPTTNHDYDHLIASTTTTANNNNENDEEEDIDSNDEEWDGNDYPDIEEELDDDPCLDDDDDDDDDDNSSEYNHTFRHRSSNLYRQAVYKDDNDDDDEIDAHYDPSYGDIYGQSDRLYN